MSPIDLENENGAADAALQKQNRELEHAIGLLAKSEQRYRALFDTCPICIKEINLSGRLISMNFAGLTMMGFEDASEAEGLDYFELLAPEERDKVRTFFASATAGNECEFESIAIFDAVPRPIASCFTPLRDSGGYIRSVMAITQDITDRRAAEERLQEENLYLREEIRLAHGFDEIIGDNRKLRRCLEAVEKVAPTDVAVLILGETGTGKELIARAIHNLSPRRDKPLVSVNCPALPESLIESELFGHERGAFTGAQGVRKGRFELADGGTIFLDELGELPLILQSKLLRVLQTGEFERLGGTETLHSDVRLIAATNRDLKGAVDKHEFRADLYYRVSSFPIHVPALRERKDDIPLLAEHFVRKHAARLGKDVDAISASMIKVLMEQSWPGNIRELESVIERALITSPASSVLVLSNTLQAGLRPRGEKRALPDIIDTDLLSVERSHIINVLEDTHWMISGTKGAASALGMPPSTLRSKMKRLGISRKPM